MFSPIARKQSKDETFKKCKKEADKYIEKCMKSTQLLNDYTRESVTIEHDMSSLCLYKLGFKTYVMTTLRDNFKSTGIKVEQGRWDDLKMSIISDKDA